MTTDDIPHVAQYLMEEYGIWQLGWRFQWDSAKRRAGQCRYGTKEISLSRHFVALNVAERLDEIVDTILHEIAHALAGPGTNHGPEWVAACDQVGARPERCYVAAVVAMPLGGWEGTCGGCGTVFRRHRPPRRGIYHTKCGPERGVVTFRRIDGTPTTE